MQALPKIQTPAARLPKITQLPPFEHGRLYKESPCPNKWTKKQAKYGFPVNTTYRNLEILNPRKLAIGKWNVGSLNFPQPDR
jgi:hypothetical protein